MTVVYTILLIIVSFFVIRFIFRLLRAILKRINNLCCFCNDLVASSLVNLEASVAHINHLTESNYILIIFRYFGLDFYKSSKIFAHKDYFDIATKQLNGNVDPTSEEFKELISKLGELKVTLTRDKLTADNAIESATKSLNDKYGSNNSDNVINYLDDKIISYINISRTSHFTKVSIQFYIIILAYINLHESYKTTDTCFSDSKYSNSSATVTFYIGEDKDFFFNLNKTLN